MSEEKQEQQEPEVIGPGALLKEARIKAGLSTAEIADKLHLKVCSIEDLESDVYDESISMTFTKGYLKLYAKQVHLPEAEVLEAFDRLNTKAKEPAKLQSFSRRVARQASDDRLMLVTYLIVFGVIALVVIWWWQQSSSDSSVSVSTLNDAQPNQSLSASPQSADVDELPAQNQIDESSEPAAQTIASGQQPQDVVEEPEQPSLAQTQIDDNMQEQVDTAVEPAVLTASVLEQPQQQDTAEDDNPESELSAQVDSQMLTSDNENTVPVDLVFEFSGDCWMNLVDATGEAIAFGVKVSGRVMPVSGIPPFEVTLGAPESVQISYDGVAVDMSQFRAGRTARFTLPLSQ